MIESTQTLGGTEWVRRAAICGDASTRSYERLWDAAGKTAVLVRYPKTSHVELSRDLEVLQWCRDRGLHVPSVHHSDVESSTAVLEDLGEADAEATVRTTDGDRRPSLCHRLIAPLVALAEISTAELPKWNAPLDRRRMRWELAGFELWFMGHGIERRPTPPLSAWLDTLTLEIASHPRRICHRDYHLNNLFFLPSEDVGVIDIQDILVGPDTYDAVSLIAERAMPELMDLVMRDEWLDSWAGQSNAQPGWRRRAALVQVQRSLKVLGTFARLVASGRPEYGPWMTAIVEGLTAPLEAADAPPELVDCLLHWSQSGGPHVR